MWISKSISKISDSKKAYEGVITQGADRRISVNGSSGVGHLPIAAPAGIICIPKSSHDAVIVPTDMGQICIGVRVPYNELELEPGEILLYSNNQETRITLKNSGTIIIHGNITLDGTINGKEI